MVSSSYSFTADEAKAIIIERIKAGASVQQAVNACYKGVDTYQYYRTSDPDFKRAVDKIRARLAGEQQLAVPPFEVFSEKYFGMKLFAHQRQWVDLLEGRRPRGLHEAQVYEPNDPDMILVNTPPFHAKSMTLSINYVTYRVIEDPNVRVIIISKTADMANKFLSAVKDRLSSNTRMFQQLKDDYAPPEGYDGNGAVWQAGKIYINPAMRTKGEKDPTVEALGIGKQIYGARADLIIMDDCVVSDNAHEFEKQINWVQNEVMTRLEYGGKFLLVGTRLKAQDLYSEIRKPVWYAEGQSPWTYLTQPAVLQTAENPEDWQTLWPKTNVHPPGKDKIQPGPDGLYPMWPGPRLHKIRSKMSPENWARVYMQAQISEATTFNIRDIDACTNQLRVPGPFVAGRRGHRPEGMAGLYVVAGIDPAAVNYTAACVLGVDRQTGKRYLLDVYNKHGALPSEINALIKMWTQRYGVMEWRIETNAYQASIVQDEDLLQWCRARGVIVSSHITSKNKWDPQFGVATMANLFRGHENGSAMIEFPARGSHAGMNALVEQLISWYPTPSLAKAPTQDAVMALWFCEIRARSLVDDFDQLTHWDSPGYLSEREKEEQVTIDIDWWMARQSYEHPSITAW